MMSPAAGCIAALLAFMPAAASAVAICDWSHPGENKFVGDKLRAIDRYHDIPPDVREQLKAKIKARSPTDIAEIQRDTIIGRHGVYSGLREMWFGASTRCAAVSRPAWSTGRIERAPVYTVGEHSIIIPDICGNVARVDWAPLDGAKQSAISSKSGAAGSAVPEPSTLLLAGAAIAVMAAAARRGKIAA